MNNKIIFYLVLLILLVNLVNAEKYFVLDVNYILGSVTFNSISLREIGKSIKITDKSGFLIRTESFSNNDLSKIYFNMSENKNYLIYIPYNENTARIEMYNSGNSKIMDIDVSSFANTCGDKICQEYESYESCPQDCPSGGRDGFCDGISDAICDPDCTGKTDIDCEKTTNTKTIKLGENKTVAIQAGNVKNQNINDFGPKTTNESTNYSVLVLLAFVIAVLVLVIFIIKKMRENKIINSIKQYINENIGQGFSLQQIKDALFREGYNQKEVEKAIKSIGL